MARGDVAGNIGTRLLAGVWSLVILTFVLPLAILLWLLWIPIQLVGMALGNTWAFQNGPGFHLANNTFTWFATNLQMFLIGNGGRPSVQWTPSTNYGGRN